MFQESLGCKNEDLLERHNMSPNSDGQLVYSFQMSLKHIKNV